MASEQIFPDVAPWPTPQASPPPKGHNKPPIEETVAAEFREELLSERHDFLQRFEDILAAADRVEVDDDDSLGRAGDLVKMFRAAATHINATHEKVKAPYLKGGRAADAERNALNGRLDEAKRTVERQMNAFMAKRDAAERAERERIAAEQRAASERAAEAERQRIAAEQEAARAVTDAVNEEERNAALDRAAAAAAAAEEAMASAALAPAAPSRPEPVRSDAGAAVSASTVWNSEVTDYQVAFIAVEDNPKVREAIDKAVAALVRAGKREIPGCRIWPTQKAIAR